MFVSGWNFYFILHTASLLCVGAKIQCNALGRQGSFRLKSISFLYVSSHDDDGNDTVLMVFSMIPPPVSNKANKNLQFSYDISICIYYCVEA
jgi:hypothetical protein